MVFKVLGSIGSAYGTHSGALLWSHVCDGGDSIADEGCILGLNLYATADTFDERTRLVDREDDRSRGEHVVCHLVERGTVLVERTVDATGIADVEQCEQFWNAVLADGWQEIEVGESQLSSLFDELLFLRSFADHHKGNVASLFQQVCSLDKDVHGGGLSVAACEADNDFPLVVETAEKAYVFVRKHLVVCVFPFLFQVAVGYAAETLFGESMALGMRKGLVEHRYHHVAVPVGIVLAVLQQHYERMPARVAADGLNRERP